MLKMYILQLVIALTLISTILSITPQIFQTNIKTQAEFYKVKTFQQTLGTTVEGNSIISYGFTTMQNVKTIQNFHEVPSILLTCLMHPREINSIKFLQQLLTNLFIKIAQDSYVKFMMQRTIVWVIPFVNIDGFKLLLDAQNGINNAKIQLIRKNRNKGKSTCQTVVQEGVDINRNFNSSWGKVKTSQRQCGQQYRGTVPFSQKQSQAIRLMYTKYNIKIAVDIHSYGNDWIYPYASDSGQTRIKQSQLYPIYQLINKELREKTKNHVSSCFEALKYMADGVYIDWALDQKVLSYAFQFGKSFNSPSINEDLQQALKSFWILFQHLSYRFKLYRHSSLKDILIVESFSFIDLKIKVRNNNYQLGPKILKSRQKLLIQLPNQQIGFKLYVEDTQFSQIYLLADLQIDLNPAIVDKEKQNQNQNQKYQQKQNQKQKQKYKKNQNQNQEKKNIKKEQTQYSYNGFYMLVGGIMIIALQVFRKKFIGRQSVQLTDQQQIGITQVHNAQIV